ncbi:MAG: hypothetical protein RL701_3351, partial [Pseudomonadota bacterium]
TGIDEKMVKGNVSTTVTGAALETITGPLTQTVTGGITITTPATVMITATAGITTLAPGGETKLNTRHWKQGGYVGDAYGIKFSMSGSKIDMAGLALATIVTKVDATGFKSDNTGTSMKKELIAFQDAKTKIKTGAIGVYMYGLTIIS